MNGLRLQSQSDSPVPVLFNVYKLRYDFCGSLKNRRAASTRHQAFQEIQLNWANIEGGTDAV